MRILYTLLVWLCIPSILLRALWRSIRIPAYRQRLHERFGFTPFVPHKSPVIWIHAVSLGESIAATPLIKALQERLPNFTLLITNTTVTGSEQIRKTFPNLINRYLPYDLPGAIGRFLNRTHPTLAIIMETELWPNLLYYTHKRHIPILLANARLSDRSTRGYQRISSLVEEMLSKITAVAAQSQIDGNRFIQLGLEPKQLLVTGNIKFDMQIPKIIETEGKKLRAAFGDRPVLIAASTHEGEEIMVLDAFKKIREKYPTALLILVPRHPDRFQKVARLCETAQFRVARRSLHERAHAAIDILLGDTMGELRLLYAASDIAFVGGSLVSVGGHNLIEPAAAKLPIITGSYLHNFIAISELLKDANALMVVNGTQSLAHAFLQLLSHKAQSLTMGERAYQVSIANTGALERHVTWIEKQLKQLG